MKLKLPEFLYIDSKKSGIQVVPMREFRLGIIALMLLFFAFGFAGGIILIYTAPFCTCKSNFH